MESKQLKETLAFACRILGNEGHDDLNLGHLSARAIGSPESIHMKGRGICLSEAQTEDLVTLDFNYKKVAGQRDTHGELPIHIEIYKKRPDVNCVVHTHPMYATAFSATKQKLRPINNTAALFARALPYFDQTTDLVVTSESGMALADTLGDAMAVVMKNHGITVVGETIETATVRAYLLEKALKGFYIAKGFGELTWSSDNDAEQKVAKAFITPKLNAMWEALVRQLTKKERQEQILEILMQKI